MFKVLTNRLSVALNTLLVLVAILFSTPLKAAEAAYVLANLPPLEDPEEGFSSIKAKVVKTFAIHQPLNQVAMAEEKMTSNNHDQRVAMAFEDIAKASVKPVYQVGSNSADGPPKTMRQILPMSPTPVLTVEELCGQAEMGNSKAQKQLIERKINCRWDASLTFANYCQEAMAGQEWAQERLIQLGRSCPAQDVTVATAPKETLELPPLEGPVLHHRAKTLIQVALTPLVAAMDEALLAEFAEEEEPVVGPTVDAAQALPPVQKPAPVPAPAPVKENVRTVGTEIGVVPMPEVKTNVLPPLATTLKSFCSSAAAPPTPQPQKCAPAVKDEVELGAMLPMPLPQAAPRPKDFTKKLVKTTGNAAKPPRKPRKVVKRQVPQAAPRPVVKQGCGVCDTIIITENGWGQPKKQWVVKFK